MLEQSKLHKKIPYKIESSGRSLRIAYKVYKSHKETF